MAREPASATEFRLSLSEQAAYGLLIAAGIALLIVAPKSSGRSANLGIGGSLLLLAAVILVWSLRVAHKQNQSKRADYVERWRTLPPRTSPDFLPYLWTAISSDFHPFARKHILDAPGSLSPQNYVGDMVLRPEWTKWQSILGVLSLQELKGLSQLSSTNKEMMAAAHAAQGSQIAAVASILGIAGIKLNAFDLSWWSVGWFVALISLLITMAAVAKTYAISLDGCIQFAIASYAGGEGPDNLQTLAGDLQLPRPNVWKFILFVFLFAAILLAPLTGIIIAVLDRWAPQ